MSIDTNALRAEIESGPLAAELAPLIKTADDAATAAVLNRKDRSGYVPSRWVVVSLARFPQVDGLVHWTMTLGTMPPELGGGPCPFALYCLFRNLDRLATSVEKGDLRADVASLAAGLAQADKAGLVGKDRPVPPEFGPYLLSGEVRIGRAEEAGLVPLDGSVTAADVGAAR